MNNLVPENENSSSTSELAAAASACTPYSGRDNTHYSSGDASGHGWWKKGNCSNNTANVKNCIYEYYTDGSWRLKACSPTKTLPPYTGSGARTVHVRRVTTALIRRGATTSTSTSSARATRVRGRTTNPCPTAECIKPASKPWGRCWWLRPLTRSVAFRLSSWHSTTHGERGQREGNWRTFPNVLTHTLIDC